MSNDTNVEFVAIRQNYNSIKRAIDELCKDANNELGILLRDESASKRLRQDANLFLNRFCKISKSIKRYYAKDADLKAIQKINQETEEYKNKLNQLIEECKKDSNVEFK